MSLLRKIFFYFFVSIYLILCPLTLLYALGYLFKPGGTYGIVKTGLIHLNTDPEGASIVLGKKRFNKRTPAILGDLLPGNYSVTASLKNYKPWSRTVPVEPGRATVLDKILLLPAEWKPKILCLGPWADILAVEETRFLILRKNSTFGHAVVYDWKNEKLRPLCPLGSAFEKAKILSFFTVAGSPLVIFVVDTSEGDRVLSIDLKEKKLHIEDVTVFFQGKPDNILWDPNDENLFFTLEGHTLIRIDAAARIRNPFFLEGVAGFGVSDRTLTILTQEGLLKQFDLDGNPLLTNESSSLFQENSLGLEEWFRVERFSKNSFFLLGNRGALWIKNPSSQSGEEGIRGFKKDVRLGEILLWKKKEIGILENSKFREETDPGQEHSLSWVMDGGERIEQVFFLDEGSHLLVRDQDIVSLLELGLCANPIPVPIVQVKPKSSILYEDNSGTLYYLNRSSGNLCSLKILPREDLSVKSSSP